MQYLNEDDRRYNDSKVYLLGGTNCPFADGCHLHSVFVHSRLANLGTGLGARTRHDRRLNMASDNAHKVSQACRSQRRERIERFPMNTKSDYSDRP